jgi:hypothetical protein
MMKLADLVEHVKTLPPLPPPPKRTVVQILLKPFRAFWDYTGR